MPKDPGDNRTDTFCLGALLVLVILALSQRKSPRTSKIARISWSEITGTDEAKGSIAIRIANNESAPAKCHVVMDSVEVGGENIIAKVSKETWRLLWLTGADEDVGVKNIPSGESAILLVATNQEAGFFVQTAKGPVLVEERGKVVVGMELRGEIEERQIFPIPILIESGV